MITSSGSRSGTLAAALAQTAAGVAAHVAAAGCLPGAARLAGCVPAAVVAVVLLGRLLPRRPLVRLACGQLTVHALLAASACAAHLHVHAPAPGHALMTVGHLSALVLCRATLDRIVRGAERAARGLAAFVRRSPRPAALVLPPATAPAAGRPSARRALRHVHRVAPRRGPPGRPAVPLLPA